MDIRKVDNILVRMEDTIQDTLKVIDSGCMGIALVVDENEMLRGTVTDGDVRRTILNGEKLSEHIYHIMQHNFTYVTEENYTEREIKKKFSKKRIKQIPILNRYKKPVGMALIEDVFSTTKKENMVLIMAGGLGTRLRPLTNKIPKPMLKVGDKPILETIINQFQKNGYNNFLISVNYKSQIIENYFQDGSQLDINIEYIREKERRGTAGAIRIAEKYLDKPFIVINGDILTNMNFANFLAYHNECHNDITIATRNYKINIPYGVINYQKDQILSIDEKPEVSFSVNGGIYAMNPSVIKIISERTYFDMNELINKALENNLRIGNYPIREYWMDIGQLEDYHQANKDYENLFWSEACATKE